MAFIEDNRLRSGVEISRTYRHNKIVPPPSTPTKYAVIS